MLVPQGEGLRAFPLRYNAEIRADQRVVKISDFVQLIHWRGDYGRRPKTVGILEKWVIPVTVRMLFDWRCFSRAKELCRGRLDISAVDRIFFLPGTL